MRAEIIAVGSELLTPYRLDTNSLFLTSQLNQLGIRVIHKVIVGDTPDEMRSSFRHALERAELIVSSGGLGPTDDDRTRQTVAELLGRKLHIDERILQHIKERFQRFRPGRVMPEINARQALVPEGAMILPNAKGSGVVVFSRSSETPERVRAISFEGCLLISYQGESRHGQDGPCSDNSFRVCRKTKLSLHIESPRHLGTFRVLSLGP